MQGALGGRYIDKYNNFICFEESCNATLLYFYISCQLLICLPQFIELYLMLSCFLICVYIFFICINFGTTRKLMQFNKRRLGPFSVERLCFHDTHVASCSLQQNNLQSCSPNYTVKQHQNIHFLFIYIYVLCECVCVWVYLCVS